MKPECAILHGVTIMTPITLFPTHETTDKSSPHSNKYGFQQRTNEKLIENSGHSGGQ